MCEYVAINLTLLIIQGVTCTCGGSSAIDIGFALSAMIGS
jgi:hypothetical protein